jgi:hypothetical protein
VWKHDGWQEAVHPIAAAALGVLGIEAGTSGVPA